MGRRLRYVKFCLAGEVVEAPPGLGFLGRRDHIQLLQLLRFLEAVKRDRRTRSLLLVVKRLSIGWAQAEEIRTAISDLVSSGVEVLVLLEQPANVTLYLASAANRVLVPPASTVDLLGLRAEVLFFADLLQHLGIAVQLISVGTYKSAGEAFLRKNMSPESREALRAVVADIEGRFVAAVSARRGVSEEEVRGWIDEGPYTARKALQKGIIDGIAYEDEVEKDLEDSGLVSLPPGRIRARRSPLLSLLAFRQPKIAIIYAEGAISTSESRRRGKRFTTVGAHTLISFLRDARSRKSIRAVVIRINSPGGSSLGSDLLWREVKLLSDLKPVVVSFSNTAASGGFYVALPARRILADANTLTGSIGVVAGKFSARSALAGIGIGIDVVESGSNAGFESPFSPFSEEQLRRLEDQVVDFYENSFLEKVAQGRGLAKEKVRGAAEGRLWTGNQAKDLGLVDEIGGLLRAIDSARKLASLRPGRFQTVDYVRKHGLRELLSLNWVESGSSIDFPGLMSPRIHVR